MAKTYLDLVNQVLKRVREPTVGSVGANLYSVLISTFINDAKRVVEDSWEWSCLWKQVDFDISASVLEYDLGDTALVGAGNELTERALLLYRPGDSCPLAWDVTTPNPSPLTEVYRHKVASDLALQTYNSTYQMPMYFSVTPTNDSIGVHLIETPSETRSWRMVFKQPQDELEDGTDEILVPWYPVVLLATNYALNERGEEIGQPGNEAEKKYMQALSDAIALDSRYSYDDLVFIPS